MLAILLPLALALTPTCKFDSDCAPHGVCLTEEGTCFCDLGFSGKTYGSDCSVGASSGKTRGATEPGFWGKMLRRVRSAALLARPRLNSTAAAPASTAAAGQQQAPQAAQPAPGSLQPMNAFSLLETGEAR